MIVGGREEGREGKRVGMRIVGWNSGKEALSRNTRRKSA